MTKRLVDIDDAVLDEARRVLGTSTLKDTVNASLRDTVQSAHRRAISEADVARFVEATEDLRDPVVMARAWE